VWPSGHAVQAALPEESMETGWNTGSDRARKIDGNYGHDASTGGVRPVQSINPPVIQASISQS
jgi:hypothetical protein